MSTNDYNYKIVENSYGQNYILNLDFVHVINSKKVKNVQPFAVFIEGACFCLPWAPKELNHLCFLPTIFRHGLTYCPDRRRVTAFIFNDSPIIRVYLISMPIKCNWLSHYVFQSRRRAANDYYYCVLCDGSWWRWMRPKSKQFQPTGLGGPYISSTLNFNKN